MTQTLCLSLIGAVIGTFLGRYIGWAIRAWPGFEKFHCDYLKCPSCQKGLEFGCCNAGKNQERIYIAISAIVAGLSVFYFGFSVKAFVSWLFVIACLIVTIVDIRTFIIPDRLSKGGIVLAIKEEVNIPVKFIGLGEKMEDLRPFDIEKYIYGLFKDMM